MVVSFFESVVVVLVDVVLFELGPTDEVVFMFDVLVDTVGVVEPFLVDDTFAVLVELVGV